MTKPFSLRLNTDALGRLERLAVRRGLAPATVGAAYVDDDLLLEACHEDGRVLVSKDRRTLPGWVALRSSEGKDHAGILFYDEERFPAPAIGTLAKAITRAGQQRRDWKNAWVTLR